MIQAEKGIDIHKGDLFLREAGLDLPGGEEFSGAGGRRNECKAMGLKPFTKAFRDCTKGLRKKDKGLSRAQKRANKKKRRSDLSDAIAEGRVKKGFVGRAFGALKKFNPVFVAMRTSALSLIKLNLWGMATKMNKLRTLAPKNADAKKAWNKIIAHWIKFGGDKNKFDAAVNTGKAKKQFLTRKSKQVKSSAEGFLYSEMNGSDEGYSNFVVTAATIAAAGTVLTTIVSVLKSAKGLVGELPTSESDEQALAQAPVDTLTPEEQKAAVAEINRQEDIADGGNGSGKYSDDAADDADKIMGIPKTAVYIGGAVLLIGGIFLIVKMSKK